MPGSAAIADAGARRVVARPEQDCQRSGNRRQRGDEGGEQAARVPLLTAIQLIGTSATMKKIAASAADQPATIHSGRVSPSVRMNSSSAATLIARRSN